MENGEIRVLLADDHTMVRTGLRLIIDPQADMTVIGEAKDGLEAIQKVQEVEPDVIVMDISMPNLGGLEASRRIKREFPEAHVLILTMHDNEQFFFQALQAGADGYVTKAAPEWELLTAIRSVNQGNCYLNSSVTKLLVGDYLQRLKRGDRMQPYDLLTDREREILHLVAAGHSNREIADILSISEHTVHNHRAHLMEKLGVHNRLELLKYAINQGIITADA
ncbi:MAG: DNA-binding response regulator [Chloroflexi bacterium RBG_16_64_32]|nr:MAG: DNA-binding response regulator [Chloroflexi bacterium RBG_16_64_32]